MLKAILNSNGDVKNDSPFSLAQDGNRVVWPESEPVIFNFRLPMDNHRCLLFDKILFMNYKQI